MTDLARLIETPEVARLSDAATPLASKAENEARWLADRADNRVTASEAHAIWRSRASWRRILSDKLYGSTFHGNAGTRRGSANEAYWLRIAEIERGTAIVANDRLWVSLANVGISATPDGFESDGETTRGVEVKDHHEDWETPSSGILTAEHLTQMLVGMWVLDLDEWVYVVGFSDDDGNPSTKRMHHIEIVRRDDAKILEILDALLLFLAWWADGAPEDEISDELRDLERAVVAANAAVDAAKEGLAKAREAYEKQLLAEHPGATKTGFAHTDSETGDRVVISRGAVTPQIDEDAWKAAKPAQYAAWVRGSTAVLEAAAAAKETYPKSKVAAHGLRVYPAKKKAKA